MCSCREPALSAAKGLRWNGFLPNPLKGQELSCHDKVAKRLRQKTMEACALDGRPINVG